MADHPDGAPFARSRLTRMDVTEPRAAVRGGERMRILAFAYACEPVKGSEPAAGWVCARMLARFADVWVFTRENNQPGIEAAVPGLPEEDHLHFEYVDTPRWMRWWKRGQRGARVYYFLWQLAAVRRARILSREIDPDIVWHLTWGNAWLGSLVPLLPQPFVFGPVGGGTGAAWRLWDTLGLRGNAFEVARSSARAAARYLNPLARIAWRRADLILAQNPETVAWFPARHRSKAAIFPHAAIEDEDRNEVRGPERDRAVPTAVFVGRLTPWKGIALALHALSHLEDWRLLICGTGSDEARLKRLARRLGVEERVRFLGWIPRERVRAMVADEADIFLFPSLHDDAPFAVAEALAAGVPVVCLDRGGPPVLGGTPVHASNRYATTVALAEAARTLAGTRSAGFPDLSTRAGELRAILGKTFRWSVEAGDRGTAGSVTEERP